MYNRPYDDHRTNFHALDTVRGDHDVAEFGPDSGQMVKLRFKPGSVVPFGIFSTVSGLVNVNVSGYLETIN